MKHLPNICTLANLFFGCIAITFILNAPVFFQQVGEDIYPVLGVEQMVYGSLFILLAAFMDVLDGFMARALKVDSPLGRDLDSLADVVSFGVAPAMILFKLLWSAYMSEPGALQTPMLVMAPAFLLPCFGALRLARYNQTSAEQRAFFSGMPIPAAGLFVASLPLWVWYAPPVDLSGWLTNRWFLYGVIALLCFLMVSKLRFLKWKAGGKGAAAWWPQIVLAGVLIAGAPFLRFAIVPVVFLAYIVLSLLYKYPDGHGAQAHANEPS